MSTDAARETARQDNGQFGTQPRAEADVALTSWPPPGGQQLATALREVVDRYDSRMEGEISDIADRIATDDFDPEAFAEELDDLANDIDDWDFCSHDTAQAAGELEGLAKQLRAGDFGSAADAPATA